MLHVLYEPGDIGRSPASCQVVSRSCEESVLSKGTFGKAVVTDDDVLERMLEAPVVQVIDRRGNEAHGCTVGLIQQSDDRSPCW